MGISFCCDYPRSGLPCSTAGDVCYIEKPARRSQHILQSRFPVRFPASPVLTEAFQRIASHRCTVQPRGLPHPASVACRAFQANISVLSSVDTNLVGFGVAQAPDLQQISANVASFVSSQHRASPWEAAEETETILRPGLETLARFEGASRGPAGPNRVPPELDMLGIGPNLPKTTEPTVRRRPTRGRHATVKPSDRGYRTVPASPSASAGPRSVRSGVRRLGQFCSIERSTF